MSISQVEAVASLHVLVALARADGKLHDEERNAIEAGLEEVGLLEVIGADEIFADDFDLDEQIALLQTPEARDETFRSAYSLAYADGECSEEEKRLLGELRGKLGISVDRETELAKLFEDVAKKPLEKKSYFDFVEDPEERGKVVARETRKCAIVSAVLGAFPVPGLAILTDLIVVGLQVGLVRDIGALHGQTVDAAKAKGLLAGLGVGTGARLAISNLAKVLPGWGSLIGATTAFASSYAVGVSFHKYFSQSGLLDEAALKEEFAKATAEGKKEYEANKATIEQQAKAKKAELDRLVAEAKAGKLDHDELAQRLSKE